MPGHGGRAGGHLPRHRGPGGWRECLKRRRKGCLQRGMGVGRVAAQAAFLHGAGPAAAACLATPTAPTPLPCHLPPSCIAQVYPYCDAVMQTLLTNLQSPDVHRNIKPQVRAGWRGAEGELRGGARVQRRSTRGAHAGRELRACAAPTALCAAAACAVRSRHRRAQLRCALLPRRSCPHLATSRSPSATGLRCAAGCCGGQCLVQLGGLVLGRGAGQGGLASGTTRGMPSFLPL